MGSTLSQSPLTSEVVNFVVTPFLGRNDILSMRLVSSEWNKFLTRNVIWKLLLEERIEKSPFMRGEAYEDEEDNLFSQYSCERKIAPQKRLVRKVMKELPQQEEVGKLVGEDDGYLEDMNEEQVRFLIREVQKSFNVDTSDDDHHHHQRGQHLPSMEVKVRNVLCLGMTRSGKSTCVEVLKNPFHQVKSLELIFSDTLEPSCSSVFVEDTTNPSGKDGYIVNLIECPGFDQVTPEGGNPPQTNDQLMNTLENFLRTSCPRIHCVLIFANRRSVTLRIAPIIDMVTQNFAGHGIKIGLVFSRSEHLNTRGKNELVNTLSAEGSTFLPYLDIDNPSKFCELEFGCLEMEKLLQEAKEVEKKSKEMKICEDEERRLLDDDEENNEQEQEIRSERIEQLRQELEEYDERYDQVISILFTGAINPLELDFPTLVQGYGAVSSMRQMILKFIFGAWKDVDVRNFETTTFATSDEL